MARRLDQDGLVGSVDRDDRDGLKRKRVDQDGLEGSGLKGIRSVEGNK